MVGALCVSRWVSEPLFQLLVTKGGGNPLYVEEIVRQLQETEGIVVENGEARLRASDVTVPETIRDIIAARVDRLGESPKQTLQVASVVGRRFGVTLVSHVRETERDLVADDLKDLHAVDFVFPSAHDPEVMYSFKHALTQDVVYTSLLERRRRRFHAAAGRGLEEVYAGRIDDVVEILAYHFSGTDRVGQGPDLPEASRAEGSGEVGAPGGSDLFQEALEALRQLPETPERENKAPMCASSFVARATHWAEFEQTPGRSCGKPRRWLARLPIRAGSVWYPSTPPNTSARRTVRRGA